MVALAFVGDDWYYARGETIKADDTLTFYIGGQWYEIDLTKGNQEKMARDLKPWTDVARKMKAPKAASPPRHAVQPKKRGPHRRPKRDWTGFKAWCDLNGRVYRGAGGSFWPKKQDIADYESWLAERQAAREGQPGDTAAGGHAAA